MRISVLSRLVDSIKERIDARFVRDTLVTEWQTKMITHVAAAAVQDESKKFVKQVQDAVKFPWANMGYAEIAENVEEEKTYDLSDLSYLEGAGDTSAADKNAGKTAPSFLGGGLF